MMPAYRRTSLEVTLDRIVDLINSRRTDLTYQDLQTLEKAISVINGLRISDVISQPETSEVRPPLWRQDWQT